MKQADHPEFDLQNIIDVICALKSELDIHSVKIVDKEIFMILCSGNLRCFGGLLITSLILISTLVATVAVANSSSNDSACIDVDGDGWGWDGQGSCLVESDNSQSFNGAGECLDSDGDGWGWDGFVSCLPGVGSPTQDPTHVPAADQPTSYSDYLADYTDLIAPGGLNDLADLIESSDLISDDIGTDYIDDPGGQISPPDLGRTVMSLWDPDCEATNGTDWRLSVDRSPHPCEYSPDNDGSGVTVYVLDGIVDTDHATFENTTFRQPVDLVNQGHNLIAANSKTFEGTLPEPIVSALAVDADSDSGVEKLLAPGGGVHRPPPSTDLTDLEARHCGPGHGTHVASVLASEEVGVASGVTVAPVRVTFCNESDGKYQQSGFLEDTIEGLEHVLADHESGPAIVNLSLGVPKTAMSAAQQTQMQNLLSDLHDDGVLVISAAGNSGDGACNSYPPAFDGGLTVGALSSPGTTYGSFNKGPCVDLYAPTRVTAADDSTGGYGSTYGTSISAPIVAGLAAIHWSANPDLTVDEVIANMKFAAARFDEDGTDCGGPCLSAKLGPSIPEIPRRTLPTRVVG